MFEALWPRKPSPARVDDRRPRILVVDDEAAVRQVVRRMLAEEDVELLEARNGKEALAVVDSQTVPIDLLLTDLRMPVMDGQELAQALRPRFPDLKVLYLTGYSDRLFVANQPLPEGCAFEDKPITTSRLLQAVNLLLYGTLTRPKAGRTARKAG